MAHKDKPTRAQAGDGGPPMELVGTTEAARILGVTPSTLRRWIREGRIESRRVGKKWRVRRSDLGKVVQVREAGPVAPPVAPAVARKSEEAIDALLKKIGLTKSQITKLTKGVESEVSARLDDSDPEARRLLAKYLLYAVHAVSSDLHVEPMAGSVKVRFRVDGCLYEAPPLPRELARPLLDEIMRWSGLSLSERRRPQDGRFLLEVGGRDIDFRISTMPTIHGNVAAMRLLDRRVMLTPIDRLGFEPEQLERYRDIIHRPNGLILVAGPTGTGKTTTLYASLSELNDPSRKILTAEDPVEYALDGIDQSPIDESIGFGFGQAARSMLRQAPNIMFIGEIRGTETGQLLCQAALTGHLVFSTLHTGDAVSAITRLLDIGVKPVLLSSALLCVVAQRLVRLICPHCKTQHRPKAGDLDVLGLKGKDRRRTFYHGKGCKRCNLTGYRGRTAIYELLELGREVGAAIMNQQRGRLLDAARSAGYRPMREVALDKLFRGETTIEEVVRETCIPDRARMI